MAQTSSQRVGAGRRTAAPPIDIRLQYPLPAAAVLSSFLRCTGYAFTTLCLLTFRSLLSRTSCCRHPLDALSASLAELRENQIRLSPPPSSERSAVRGIAREDRRQPYSGRCRLAEGGGRQQNKRCRTGDVQQRELCWPGRVAVGKTAATRAPRHATCGIVPGRSAGRRH